MNRGIRCIVDEDGIDRVKQVSVHCPGCDNISTFEWSLNAIDGYERCEYCTELFDIVLEED